MPIKKGLILLLILAACGKATPPPAKEIPVVAATAVPCDVPRYYDYIGHVIPLNTVSIVPQVQGYLTRIYFQEGQEVKKGDLLATIDDRPYKAALAKAEAMLAQNVVALKYSEETVTRYSKLVPEDYVSQLNFDKYVSDVMTDEAVIKQNLADIEAAKLNVEFTQMHATVDGVVGVRLIDQGNYIPAGTTNPIVILNQLKPITVEFYVPEDDLCPIRNAKAKSQLITRVFLEGDTNFAYDGELTLIDNQVNLDTGSILLRGMFPNEDSSLWPNQFVTVRLFLETIHNAILIPSTAIIESQKGPYVFIVTKENTAEQRFIKRGQVYEDQTLVEQGIAAGEQVVIEGHLNLYPGILVALQNSTPPVSKYNPGRPAR